MNLRRRSEKLFFIFLIGIFMITLVSAEGCDSAGFMGRFNQSTNITLTETCPTCTFINLTIKNPKSEIVVLNEQMTLSNSIFNFTANASINSELGTYIVEGHSNLDTPFKACYIITNITREISTSESFIYFILVGGVFLVFLICLWGSIAIPFANPRNEFGQMIDVSFLKYFKVGLIFLSYALFVWLMNLFLTLSNNLVTLTQYGGFFQMMMQILLNMTYVLFVIMVISFFVMGARDLKLNDLLSRGLQPR